MTSVLRRRSLRQLCSAHALALSVAWASEARAQVALQLSIDPPQPVAGEPFHIIYGVSMQGGAGVVVQPLAMPEGLDVLSRPDPPTVPSGMMMGGGMFMFRSSVTYVVRARRPGRYVVRNAMARSSEGRVLAQLAPLTINVGRSSGNAPQVAPDPGFNNPFPGLFDPVEPPPEPALPTGPDVPPDGTLTGAQASPTGFLRAVVDVAEPYVGQQVIYRAFIYVPANEAGCEPMREATLDGFWSEVLMEPRQVCAQRWIPQRVGTWTMTAGMVRRLALFPTHAGRLEIGPLRMGVEYIEGDGFFGRRRREELSTPAIVIEAREPPMEGRPPGYVPGTIGPLSISASIDRPEVPVGETATLTVRAQGNGYLGSVTLPPPRGVEGLRVLPGSSRSSVDRNAEPLRGDVVNEYRVVADRPGRFTLPTLTVPWFDPSTRRYQSSQVVLPVIVATGAARPAEEAADPQDPSIALEGLQRDVSLRASTSFFTTPLRVWGTLSVIPGAVLLAGLGYGLRRWSRARRVVKAETAKNDPRSLLAQADAALAAGDAAGALGLGARALDRAERGARSPGEALTQRARAAREAGDGLRFAGAAVDRDAVATALRELRAVVEAMEAAS
ncbi:MAG: hypothetical protein EPO40_32420 [Myxococcaceae bacterium]|nr:MAG: hypothetical protein EPO40_32420 [Myxococcaceae bacterium]